MQVFYKTFLCFSSITAFSAFGTISVNAQGSYDPRIPLSSDSGRTLRGFADFSRYRAPSMCRAMVIALSDRARRSWAKDTLDPAVKMIQPRPALAIEEGKKCASRFAPATVDSSELQHYEQLALEIGDDALAKTILERRLSLVRTVHDSAEMLQQSVLALTTAQPFRGAEAKATIARLQQLGPQAARATFLAQMSFVQERVRYNFDPSEQTTIAAQAIAQAQMLSASDRDELASVINYAWGARLQSLLFLARDSTIEVGAQMVGDITTLRGGTYSDFSSRFREMFALQVFPKLGKPLDSFGTDINYLFSSVSSPELRKGQLPQGKVYLVMIMSEIDDYSQGYIRRLHERYAKQGLSIIVVSGTKGYTAWNSSGVLTPAEEAESLRKLAYDHLKLPITLMVEDVPFQLIPDGRKNYGVTQWYSRLPVGSAIINRDGTLEMGFLFSNPGEVEAYLKRALQAPMNVGDNASAGIP